MVNQYKKNGTKKWIVCFIVIFLSIPLGFAPYTIYRLTHSVSDRKHLDNELKDYFGDYKISESLLDVLVVSYDWNS